MIQFVPVTVYAPVIQYAPVIHRVAAEAEHITIHTGIQTDVTRCIMKKFLAISVQLFILTLICSGQYNKPETVISGGVNFSKYLGNGEGNNYFEVSNPGFQFEFTVNSGNGFEWILYGFAHYRTFNYVETNEVPVEFWIPYYTEFLFYQKTKKNPLFFFFGYDYARMKFPNMEKPDSHHNITFGAGWNIKLFNRMYLQFKAKPYLILDNSIGQKFGINGIVNLHLGLSKRKTAENIQHE